MTATEALLVIGGFTLVFALLGIVWGLSNRRARQEDMLMNRQTLQRHTEDRISHVNREWLDERFKGIEVAIREIRDEIHELAHTVKNISGGDGG